MSDVNTENIENNDNLDVEVTEKSSEKIFSQDEMNAIVGREKAALKQKYADYDSLKSRLEEIESANQTDAEKAVKAAVSEREAQLRGEFNQKLASMAIDAAAAGRFADVEDARLRLAPKAADFIVDGEVDTDLVKLAVEDILTASPHLAAGVVQTPTPAQTGLGVQGSKAPASAASAFGSFFQDAVNS